MRDYLARRLMGRVSRIELPQSASMGVAIEGSSSAWPDSSERPVLPEFDPFNRQRRYIDVFNRGSGSFVYAVETESPWIVLSSLGDVVTKEDRIWITINWERVPEGVKRGMVRISRVGGDSVEIDVPVAQTDLVTRETLDGFVEGGGYVSIEAEHFTGKVSTEQARWEKVYGYGRTLSAMTILPVTAESVQPPKNSPFLEYKMYLFTSGKVNVQSTFAPTLNFNPDRGLRYAVSFDDEKPRIIDILPQGYDARNGNREWEESVRNSVRTIRSEHELSKSGYHTLKIWMVDPAIVLERIVVDLGGLKPSYLGPPESYFRID